MTCVGAFFWNEQQVAYFDREEARLVDSLKTHFKLQRDSLLVEFKRLDTQRTRIDTLYLTLKANEKNDLNNVDSLPYDSLVQSIRFSLLHD